MSENEKSSERASGGFGGRVSEVFNSGDAQNASSRADDIVDHYGTRQTDKGSRFFAWLGRQSFQRFLGLIVGETRALEARLADKDKEIEWLRARLAVKDSPPSIAATTSQVDNVVPVQPSPLPPPAPISKLGHAIELDKLKELFFYDPNELGQKIEDMKTSNTAKDQRLLKDLSEWLETVKVPTPAEEGGTVIMS